MFFKLAGKYCLFFIVSSKIYDTVWFFLKIYLKLLVRCFFYYDWSFCFGNIYFFFEIYYVLSATSWNAIKWVRLIAPPLHCASRFMSKLSAQNTVKTKSISVVGFKGSIDECFASFCAFCAGGSSISQFLLYIIEWTNWFVICVTFFDQLNYGVLKQLEKVSWWYKHPYLLHG